MGNAGTAIKTMRKAQNLSQRDLARLSGVSHGHVAMVESGKRVPSPRVVEALTEALAKYAAGDDL